METLCGQKLSNQSCYLAPSPPFSWMRRNKRSCAYNTKHVLAPRLQWPGMLIFPIVFGPIHAAMCFISELLFGSCRSIGRHPTEIVEKIKYMPHGRTRASSFTSRLNWGLAPWLIDRMYARASRPSFRWRNVLNLVQALHVRICACASAPSARHLLCIFVTQAWFTKTVRLRPSLF
jgi:hypothetical protein